MSHRNPVFQIISSEDFLMKSETEEFSYQNYMVLELNAIVSAICGIARAETYHQQALYLTSVGKSWTK